MNPHFFKNKEAFRKWLERNYDKETELLVGFYKVGSGRPSMSWSDSVDVALCFGWIDAVRRSVDEHSYTIRFTRRKPTSIWSAINIAKVEELTKQGLMTPAGLAAFQKRKESNSRIYAYENEAKTFSGEYEELFKANAAAWSFFNAQAPWYKKTLIHWVVSAKQESTRGSRLATLIEKSAAGIKMR